MKPKDYKSSANHLPAVIEGERRDVRSAPRTNGRGGVEHLGLRGYAAAAQKCENGGEKRRELFSNGTWGPSKHQKGAGYVKPRLHNTYSALERPKTMSKTGEDPSKIQALPELGVKYNTAMFRCLILMTTIAITAYAQNRSVAGDYAGMLGPYHVKVHLAADSSGKLTGTADNSDLGMVGMPCENIRVDGQTLSFTVPTVQGTWTGFVSADGNTLSGMWRQGANPVALNFTRSTGTSQEGGISRPGATAPGEVKWDDYVFKFLSGGNMAQIYQDGKLVGTIVTVNGQAHVSALPGTDAAKLQKSYQDYQTFNARSHGEASPAAPAAVGANAMPVAPAAPGGVSAGVEPKSLGFSNDGKADPTGIKFEGKTVTVPRTDGMIVTLEGDDVTISSARGPMYVLRRKKGSVGRTLEQSLGHRNAVGGGIGGGGIEFLRAGGGLIYDSGMGGYNLQESPGVRMAKQLALVAVDAIEAVRQVPGHAGFKPSGYNALKEVSQYRLRSDGSR